MQAPSLRDPEQGTKSITVGVTHQEQSPHPCLVPKREFSRCLCKRKKPTTIVHSASQWQSCPLPPRQGFLEKDTNKPCPLVLCFLVAQPQLPLNTVLSPQLCSPKGAVLPPVSQHWPSIPSPTATSHSRKDTTIII